MDSNISQQEEQQETSEVINEEEPNPFLTNE